MYNLVTSQSFEAAIMVVIIINVITMAMVYDDQPETWTAVFSMMNTVFTFVFIGEAVLKHIGLGCRGYWGDRWNVFDFIVVAGSIADMVLTFINTTVFRAFRVGRVAARLFRILRVTRVVRLAKAIEGLHRLIMTLMTSLPSLLNVGSLLMLLFFIYAVLGVFAFGEVVRQVCCRLAWLPRLPRASG